MEEKRILIKSLDINYKTTESGMPVFSGAGIRVFPKNFKEKATVLILHGWGGSSDSWVAVQNKLTRKGYKVIAPDFPGFGKSMTPPEAWGIKDYADFVLEFIKKTNLDNFFLIGHSFGGRISVRLASECPEKIKGLILCDAAGIKPKMGFKTKTIFMIARLGNAIFTPKHLARFKDGMRGIFYAFLRNKDYVKAKGTMRETIIKVLDEDLSPELPKISAKTLVVWGQADKMVPVKYAHVFNKEIANSEIEIIPKIGHSPHIEVPEKLAEIILKFLEKTVN